MTVAYFIAESITLLASSARPIFSRMSALLDRVAKFSVPKFESLIRPEFRAEPTALRMILRMMPYAEWLMTGRRASLLSEGV